MIQRLGAYICSSLIVFVWFCLWAAPANSETAAVIIGNSQYGAGLPDVTYAERDADAIRAYLTDVLGFDADNIIDLRNATKAQMETALGTATNPQGKLWRYAGAEDGEVFVYYSGHGVSGLSDQRQYLLPIDALPDFAELNGYPLATLYRNLQNFKRATVVIDSCFSGSSAGGTLFPSSSGGVIVPLNEPVNESLTVLTAAGSNQLASWDHQARLGLFTEYFLRGVYGGADENNDGVVWADELKTYLDNTMTKAARREYGREQNVSLTGNVNRVFASFTPDQKPVRPGMSDSSVSGEAEAAAEPPSTAIAAAPPEAGLETDLQDEREEPRILHFTQRYGVAVHRAPVFDAPRKGAETITFLREDQALMLTGRTPNGKWLEADVNGLVGYVRRAAVADLERGELRHWQAAKNSGQLKDYRVYLRKYPNGYFADRAVEFIEDDTVYRDDITIHRPPPPPPRKRPPLRERPFMPGHR